MELGPHNGNVADDNRPDDEPEVIASLGVGGVDNWVPGSRTRPYYGYETSAAHCTDCGWSGLGADLTQGDMYSEWVEFDCPECHEIVFVVSFPTRAEVAAAADAGDESAKAQLVQIEKSDRRWAEVLQTRDAALKLVPELDDGEVRCRLSLRSFDDEDWYVLTGNEIELHRELAVWESIEPAERLLALCRERFGPRLVEFDYSEAFYFLAGDRLRSIDELKRLVGDLEPPEHR